MRPNDYNDSEHVKLREKVQQLQVDVARLQEGKKAADEALTLARMAMQRQQDASNEWRQENIDQRTLYPTSGKVDGMLAAEAAERRALEGRITSLENLGSKTLGRSSAFDDVWLKFVVVFTLMISAVGLIVTYFKR